MSTKKERMIARIESHAEDLKAIFPNAKKSGYALCSALLRLEHKANRIATDYCNGESGITSENWDEKTAPVIASVCALLGLSERKAEEIGLFINGDARGYSLKLSDAWTAGYRKAGGRIYTDLGGYGILAPDLNFE